MVLLYLMQTRFYIERRKDGSGNLMLKDRPVFMSVAFRGDRVMLGTGIKTDFHGWDADLQRIKKSYPGSYSTNAWLDTLAETAQKAWTAMQDSWENPDAEQFRSKFNEIKPKYSTGFFDVFFLFLESGSTRWSTSTYRKVRTIYKHLREFENKADLTLSFRNINASFLSRFEDFYAEKGNNDATTYKAVNIIVWFLNWATENGYNANLEYRRFYKSLQQPVGTPQTHHYLQWEELLRLTDYQCRNRKQERVRDLFSFMCFTGLRFSEMQNLRKQDVGEKEVIVRKPNGKVRRIPLNGRPIQIHEKYSNKYYLNNTAFPSMSIITMNKYLKILGREAGLVRQVHPVIGTGEKVPVYECLTAGVAIHTFISNAIELEIPAEIISSFTGVRKDSRIGRIKMDLARQEISKLDSR